jgi:FAD/FMN-containing dehydrogenase
MTQLADSGIDDLRTAIEGPVVTPGDDGYDDARRVWNADHDRRPAVIARCKSSDDVAGAIAFAVKHDLEIAVRGGAHSVAGDSAVDDGLVIDLSLLNQVTVDPEARTAKVGGGALLRDLDAATQAHGLAVPSGQVSHTGVGGLTLGGGLGWLTRQFGLTIDNLLSAQVVLADGRVLRAAADENADLFWALRGGGGNFGVVTEFEFRLHEVGPIVQHGILFWDPAQGAEVLKLARDFIPASPREVTITIAAMNAPPAPFVPEHLHFQPGFALLVNGFGPAEQHAAVLDELRTALPPLFEFAAPMPYTAVQQMIDEPTAWGAYNYEKGAYFEELTDETIAVITEHVARKKSPFSLNLWYRLDHAYSEVDDDATAFSGGRSPRYATFIVGVAPTAEDLAVERAWARAYWEALSPHAISTGSYINSMGENDLDRIAVSYGAKYERLAKLKAQYDPGNIFHRNANIKPAS